jgi:hypothetical protein
LSAERFCQLPDVLHIKRIGVGALNLEISASAQVHCSSLPFPLRNEGATDVQEPRVTYVVTDGSRVYRFDTPQYGSIIDYMFADARLVIGKIVLLF